MVLNMADFFELLEIAPNSLQRLQNRSKMTCDCLRDGLFRSNVNSQVSKIGRFWTKGLAHGFEHGRFREILEIAPNSLQRLQNLSKMICDCFRDCLCRFRGNSHRLKIGPLWAKGMGYSPWFWTWPILWTPGNCSKLSETPPKPF